MDTTPIEGDGLVAARAREAALREILEVIARSRDDEQPVFEAIIENARNLCEAKMAAFVMGEEGGGPQVMVANRGATEETLQIYRDGHFPMDPEISTAARAIITRRTIHLPDMADTDLYRQGHPNYVSLVDQQGIRTNLLVPLISQGRGIGCLILFRDEVRPYSDDQIELVETFAAQAVIAIENVRQFRELQTRLEREGASREILQVISRNRDDATPVFDILLRTAQRLCGASNGAIVLGEEGGGPQILAAQTGASEETLERYRSGGFPMDPAQSLAARAIVEQRTLHFDDVAGSAPYREGMAAARMHVEKEGIRSSIYVPLISNGKGIGCLNLLHRQQHAYSDDEIALVETFAELAVIAIENVRQFRELQTRLAREQATGEVLELISRSRDNSQPVFDAIIERAVRLCDVNVGLIFLVDEDREHFYEAASLWLSEGKTDAEVGLPDRWPLDAQMPIATAIRGGRTLHMRDMTEVPEYRAGEDTYTRLVDGLGYRTYLFVPLLSGGETFGGIALIRTAVRPFAGDEIALVETFAAQAVIAIENVRQFRELQTRLEREAASAEILKVISESRDDEGPVFDVILSKAMALCDAPLAFLSVVDEDRTHFRVPAHRGAGAEMSAIWDEARFPLEGTGVVTAQAVARKSVIHVPDLADEGAFTDRDERRDELAALERVRTYLVIPMIRGGEVVGTINLYRREVKPFTPDQIALVETFAAQAVIAIENVRQFRELQTRLEREAATRDVLDVISRSRDDEQPVFQIIVDRAAALCNAHTARLHLANDQATHFSLTASWGPDLTSYPIGHQFPLSERGPVASAINECRFVSIDDLRHAAGTYENDEHRQRLVERDGVHSYLTVPLIDEERAIGAIALGRQEQRSFSDDEIALVQTFAAQAVIAIENVRQFRELQTRLEREAATGEVLAVISRSRDDEAPVFDVILENAARLCGAPHAFLQLRNEADTHLVVAAQNFATSRFLDRLRANPIPTQNNPGSISVLGMNSPTPTHYDDVARLKGTNLYTEQLGYAIDDEGMGTAVFVPLISNGRGIGVIVLYKLEVAPFSEDEIGLVQTFAAQAVIAIENVNQFKALEALNAELGDRVEDQVGEIERMGKLKRFLPAAVADAVVSSGSEKMLKSHRALLGILFCDMRGFTAFCETAEPEETIEVLQTYHQEMGRLIAEHGAGVDHRMGDGIMVLFNDPLPCEDPAGEAVRLAIAMRETMVGLCARWKKLGHRLGFGVGISLGYATVGMVGYEGRSEYTASGTAVNLAARLCDHAEDGEILLSPRAAIAVEDDVVCEPGGVLELKGLSAPVEVMKAVGLR